MKRSTSVLLLALLMASLPPGLAAEDDGLVAGLRARAIGGIGYG